MSNGNVIAAEFGKKGHATTSAANKDEWLLAVKNVFSIGAMTIGSILAMSALIIWPVSYLEGWRSDPLVTVMLILSLALITAGVHYRDVLEARSALNGRECNDH